MARPMKVGNGHGKKGYDRSKGKGKGKEGSGQGSLVRNGLAVNTGHANHGGLTLVPG